VHFLSLFGSSPSIRPVYDIPTATSNTLLSQVEAWMTEISPGVRLNVKLYAENGSYDVQRHLCFGTPGRQFGI